MFNFPVETNRIPAQKLTPASEQDTQASETMLRLAGGTGRNRQCRRICA
jgi:hypothetical protein